MEFEEWLQYIYNTGQESCSCNHPGRAAPCHWCTDGCYKQFEYWCEENDRTPIYNNKPQKDTSMRLNRKNFAEFFRTDFYLISVRFPAEASVHQAASNKAYTYKVPKDVVLDLEDKVVVCVSNDPDTAWELKITTVIKIDRDLEALEEGSINYKWIVGRSDEILAKYKENIAKDNKLKQGVAKLEQALERVSLRQQLAMAMKELDEDTKRELGEIFGSQNLLESGSDNSEEKA